MGHRLTAEEVSLLATDTQHTPGHIGTVDVLDAGPDFDSDDLVRLIAQRLDFVPRYRMRVLQVPGGLAAPLWVEDADFDLSYHVRRSALPRPGTMQQLQEFVGRVMARRLDRQRPLWEVYLVEGLQQDRIAIVTKSHQCLVDGVDAVDLTQVLFDETPDVDPTEPSGWEPVPEPRPVDLLVNSVMETLSDPEAVVETARRGVTGLLGTAVAIGETVGGFGGALGELAGNALRGRPPADSPLAAMVSEQRRFETVSLPLAELKALRVSDRYTVNDVVMAVLTSGLRSWLQGRGDPLTRGELLALVPMSVQDDDGEPTSLGSKVAPHLMSLPIGEGNALMRLHQVSFGTRAHTDTGRAVGARVITDIAGFAPTTLHVLGVRAGQAVVRKPHDLLVTNVPGPQLTLYAAGAPMVASYPVIPLSAGHLLAIGVTSYNGEVFIGLNADRDELADLDVLAQCLREALAELTETAAQAASARQPTRAAGTTAGSGTGTRPTRKAGVRKGTAKKAATTTSATKKAAATKPPAKKAAAKKTAVKKVAAQQAASKKAASKKAASKQAVSKNRNTPEDKGTDQ